VRTALLAVDLSGPTANSLRPPPIPAPAQLLGEDTNERDGWALVWQYKDEPLLAHLTVKAVGANGALSPGVVLGLYHPEPNS
jgi:hypothetical protein